MGKNLVATQDFLLGRIDQICNKFGLNSIMAQLYAVLYLSNKVLSLNDMVERLKISKGSVSITVRKLERYGAVRRVWVKGSRRDYYEADTDIAKVIMDRVKLIGQLRLSEFDDMIKSSYQILNSTDSLDKDEDGTIEVFRQRLDRLERFRSQAQSLFNLFNSGFLRGLVNSKLGGSKKEFNCATSLDQKWKK